MELMASGTALIVIDMQNSFCSDAGGCDKAGLPVENLKVAIELCGQLIAAVRDFDMPVIYTRCSYHWISAQYSLRYSV
jgi:nicotinamidase-related amidase